MAVLAWRDTFNVGVEPLDDEHQKLFGLLRALEASITGSLEPETPARLLSKLKEATREHFAQEEAVMRAVKYPGLALHCANHQRLTEKLEAFNARHERGGQTLNQHALNFLSDWLLYHVQNDDVRLGDWLRERKPKQNAGTESVLEG